MRCSAFVLVAVAAVGWVTDAAAQTYPTRTIRLVNPFSPGAASDLVARNFAAKLSESMGQQVVVETRLGFSGNIAGEFVARSPADGYTLLMGSPFLAVNTSLYPKMTYDPQKDFTPISMVTAAPLILCVHPTLPVKTTKELIALAKKNPDELYYASAGNGSSMHLAGELFNMMAGIKSRHVPYKGSAAGVIDLVSGRLHYMINPMPEPLGFIKTGKLRALATTTPNRIAALPDVPPLADAVPGYEVITWHGIVAPAGTPTEVVNRLHTEIVKALKTPEFSARLREMGLELYGTTPAQFAQFIRSENVKWAKVIKATGLSLD